MPMPNKSPDAQKYLNLIQDYLVNHAGDEEQEHMTRDEAIAHINVVFDLLAQAEPEHESQASKHADAGWMNDVRFGECDGPDY